MGQLDGSKLRPNLILIRGMFKKGVSGVLGALSCSRTGVRSARQSACGLAERTFLNIPPSTLCQRSKGEFEDPVFPLNIPLLSGEYFLQYLAWKKR